MDGTRHGQGTLYDRDEHVIAKGQFTTTRNGNFYVGEVNGEGKPHGQGMEFDFVYDGATK